MPKIKNEDLSPAEEMELIKKATGQRTFERPVKLWLDTGSKRLNSVLGSEELGLAYGRMIELYGPNSHGKTMIALFIAAIAQKDGAEVAWVDLEQSFDEQWVKAQGVDYSRVFVFQLELGHFKGEKEPRLETAEELFERVELWMARKHKSNPAGRMLVVTDSIAAILTEREANAGLTGQNMSTNQALPQFLSKFLRRWVALTANYNAMAVFINQIRNNIGGWGAPEGAPGGNATKHYCSVRATVRRVKGGRMLQGRNVVGLRGIIKNVKNKAGAGSLEGFECGFETKFGKKSWKFPSVQDVRKDESTKENE